MPLKLSFMKRWEKDFDKNVLIKENIWNDELVQKYLKLLPSSKGNMVSIFKCKIFDKFVE